jgi:hypothetical protein
VAVFPASLAPGPEPLYRGVEVNLCWLLIEKLTTLFAFELIDLLIPAHVPAPLLDSCDSERISNKRLDFERAV